jgi:hypothetical protein
MKRKTKATRRSLKGKWGNVGAPPKTVNWPRTSFTMKALFSRNSKGGNAQCELSLRNKVDAEVAAGNVLALLPKKQAGGKVGRPKSMFVLKRFYKASKHELAPKSVAVLRPQVSATPAPVATPPPFVVAAVVTPPPVELFGRRPSSTPSPAPASPEPPVES